MFVYNKWEDLCLILEYTGSDLLKNNIPQILNRILPFTKHNVLEGGLQAYSSSAAQNHDHEQSNVH